MVHLSLEESVRLGIIRYAPAAVLVVLLVLTGAVVEQLHESHRALVANHTAVVSLQSAQRLQTFVSDRLRIVEIFAQRWANHEARDFSQQRFEEFASVLIDRVPGYGAVELVTEEDDRPWRVPSEVQSLPDDARPQLEALMARARRDGVTVLSTPIVDRGGSTVLLAVRSLLRGDEFLGFVVVHFEVDALLEQCFDERLREGFAIWIHDDGRSLYHQGGAVDVPSEAEEPLRAEHPIELHNRRWVLTMIPHTDRTPGWLSYLPAATLGLLLSLGMSALAFFLIRRMELYREARDQALSESAAREEAQMALSDSEARYRSVFESASDGLVVIDTEGTVIEVNRTASLMSAVSPGELRGQKFTELFTMLRGELWQHFLEQLELVGTARLELFLDRVDGDVVDIELRGAGFSFGGTPRILVLLTDVTERKQAEKRHAMLSRKVLVAQEEERARISRELHDELGQLLTATRLELGLLKKYSSSDAEEALRSLESSMGLVERTATELRHICKRLRPPMLDDLGLEPAVQQLIDDFTNYTKLEVDEEIDLREAEAPLPREITLCAYRILQESLTNIGRHAEAHSVAVSLVQTETELTASIYDDGCGFEAEDLPNLEGSGMTGMRERANLVGGRLEILSAPFQGTRVKLRVPLRESDFVEVP